MAHVIKKAHELRRGDVIVGVSSNTRLPVLVVLRVRAGGITIQVDVWDTSGWRMETTTLPANADCAVEAADMPARPTMREVLDVLQGAATEGYPYEPGSYGAQVNDLLERARRWGFL